MFFSKKIKNLFSKKLKVKPILLFQSDDWGKAGIKDLESLKNIKEKGNPWDKYGTESEQDLDDLQSVFKDLKDHKGNNLQMTANIIFANLDIETSLKNNLEELHYLPIKEGFPNSEFCPISKYQELVRNKVFYPSLHGYTHFNYKSLHHLIQSNSEFRKRAELLFQNNIQYLASVTPEINFALVNRKEGKDVFEKINYQKKWIEKGIGEFKDVFGFSPITTCAPGYRFNSTTSKIWKEKNINVIQTGGNNHINIRDKQLILPRTIHFEPVFNSDNDILLQKAIQDVKQALKDEKPIIISSHSVNFVEDFNFNKERTLSLVKKLISEIKKLSPEIEFINEDNLLENYKKHKIGEKDSFFVK